MGLMNFKTNIAFSRYARSQAMWFQKSKGYFLTGACFFTGGAAGFFGGTAVAFTF